MKKHTIWSSEINLDHWRDFLEEYPDITDEYEQYDLVRQMNNYYLYDERMNLHKDADGRILVIANLGLWNGRRQAYKILTENIADILYSDCDYAEWYSDGYNIKGTGWHHDGTNYYEYRVVREDRNIENLLDDIYAGKEISRKKLNYYTKSLHPYVAKVYGW